jgi:quercetin dioxygenase-like cupin family protein
MTRWDKGPFIVTTPAQATVCSLPGAPGVDLRLRLGPHNLPANHFSAGELDFANGTTWPQHSHEYADVVLYAMIGDVELRCGTRRWMLQPDTTAWVRHGTPYSLHATQRSRLFWVSTPPGFESDALRSADAGESIDTSGATAYVPSAQDIVVLADDEGDSYWQPVPTRGYATAKLPPSRTGVAHFAMGIQTIAPGGGVLPEHAHATNDEMKLVIRGSGHALMNGTRLDVETGTLVYNGRWVRHAFTNPNDTEMAILWMIFPPGLERFLARVGRRREPGTPEPAPFEFPPEMAALATHHGFETAETRAASPTPPVAVLRG